MAELNLPQLEDKGNEMRESGTKTHEAIDYEIDGRTIPMDLDTSETFVKDKCVDLRDKLHANIFGSRIGEIQRLPKERYWMLANGKKILSGEPDDVVRLDKTWVICDFKRGPVPVPQGPRNWQIHGYALCLRDCVELSKQFGFDTLYGVILQPLVTLKPTVLTIRGTKLNNIRTQVVQQFERMQMAGQPRVPGEWCQYCPARHHCTEAMTLAPILEKKFGPLSSLTAEQMLELRPKIKLAAKMIAAFEDAFKQKVFSEEIPGWESYSHSAGFSARYDELYKIVEDTVPKAAYKEAISVSVPKVRDMWVNATASNLEITKKEALAAWKKNIEDELEPNPPQIRIREIKDEPKKVQETSKQTPADSSQAT
jgi:hypothetical protein